MLGRENVQVQKNNGPKQILGPKNSVSKKIGPKKNSGQNLVKIRLVLADIHHYNETRTNIARTNVAWSNVPRQLSTNTIHLTN